MWVLGIFNGSGIFILSEGEVFNMMTRVVKSCDQRACNLWSLLLLDLGKGLFSTFFIFVLMPFFPSSISLGETIFEF